MSIVKIQSCQGAPVTLKQKHIVTGGRVFAAKCSQCYRFSPYKKHDDTMLAPGMHKGECKNLLTLVSG